MTSVSMRLSLRKAFKGPRKSTGGCYRSPARTFENGQFLPAAAPNATGDRSVSSNYLYRTFNDHMIAELV
jgi:hypothetical protein